MPSGTLVHPLNRGASRVTITVSGAENVLNALDRGSAVLLAAVKQIVAQVALRIRNDAATNAPVKTGYLKNSIGVEIRSGDGLGANIYADAEYAIFVEFGTGRRGSGSGGNAFQSNAVGYHYGSSAGAAAQPFLFPAFDANTRTFVSDIESAIVGSWGP